MGIVSWIRHVDKIDRLVAQLEPEVIDILGKVTNDAFGVSQGNAPVDQGTHKGTGTVGGGGLLWTITYSAEHSIYVHEGTYKMTARPHLRNACMAQVPSMRAAFAQLEGRLI